MRTLAHTPTITAPAMASAPTAPMMSMSSGTDCTPTTCVPTHRAAAPRPRMISRKTAVMATSRRNGSQFRGPGGSRSGSSRTSMVMAMAVNRMPTAMKMPVHIWPLATSGPTVRATMMTGSRSIIALTPENRPRYASGTRSGMRPCSAPWAALDAICEKTSAPNRNQYEGEAPTAMMARMLPSVPSKINGRRRPHRKVLRSESIPNRAWARRATMRVYRRIVP